MKWLIVGGGQLAKSLEAELTTSNIAFISLTRSQLDISDKNQVNDVLFAERPNVVVNAAAWTNVDLAETHEAEARIVNALGPEFLAQASMQIESSFVQISTDYVFSGEAKDPYSETEITEPKSAYGRTKLAGELAVRENLPNDHYIVRTAWLYGQHGPNFVKTMINLEKTNDSISVVEDQIGQPTWTKDLSAQIISMIDSPGSLRRHL